MTNETLTKNRENISLTNHMDNTKQVIQVSQQNFVNLKLKNPYYLCWYYQ